MQSFNEYHTGTIIEASVLEMDILGVIKSFNGSAPVVVEDDYVSTTVPTKVQLDRIIDNLPLGVDYEILVHSIDSDFADAKISVVSDGGDEQEDYEYEIDEHDVDDSRVVYELLVYTYNTKSDESLEEIKRIIKINAKGKRRIKMQCKKGFKFDGTKCVKISGGELVNKRKAIRRSVRTKKAKGSGFQKRTARLRNRAIKKRHGMGL